MSEDFQTRIYDELRDLAAAQMARERSCHTLAPTALVHEAWIRLEGSEAADPANRALFFHAAAESMRRILIEHARSKMRLKRGGADKKRQPVNLDEFASFENPERIMAVDEAIQRMAEDDPQAGAVVRLRFFAGLSVASTAETLGLSERTVNREWTYARARLRQILDE